MERIGSGLARCACVDREGVNALGDQTVQRIIYEPMPRHAGRSGEAPADNHDAEMAAFAATGVPDVLVAVVMHFEHFRLEGGGPAMTVQAEDIERALRAAFESSGSGLMCRATYRAWPSAKTSSRPVRPKTLKLAQVEIEYE